MEFSYGKGHYLEGEKKLFGTIILGEHKLYVRGPEGDYAQSFIPLEKVERLCQSSHGLELFVRPSLAYRYQVLFTGEKSYLVDLRKDIVERRGFKKKFLKQEWFEVEI